MIKSIVIFSYYESKDILDKTQCTYLWSTPEVSVLLVWFFFFIGFAFLQIHKLSKSSLQKKIGFYLCINKINYYRRTTRISIYVLTNIMNILECYLGKWFNLANTNCFSLCEDEVGTKYIIWLLWLEWLDYFWFEL